MPRPFNSRDVHSHNIPAAPSVGSNTCTVIGRLLLELRQGHFNCADRPNSCTGLLYWTATTPSARRTQRFRKNIPLPSWNLTKNTPLFNTHFTNNTVKVCKLRWRSVNQVPATSLLALTIFLLRLTFLHWRWRQQALPKRWNKSFRYKKLNFRKLQISQPTFYLTITLLPVSILQSSVWPTRDVCRKL